MEGKKVKMTLKEEVTSRPGTGKEGLRKEILPVQNIKI